MDLEPDEPARISFDSGLGVDASFGTIQSSAHVESPSPVDDVYDRAQFYVQPVKSSPTSTAASFPPTFAPSNTAEQPVIHAQTSPYNMDASPYSAANVPQGRMWPYSDYQMIKPENYSIDFVPHANSSGGQMQAAAAAPPPMMVFGSNPNVGPLPVAHYMAGMHLPHPQHMDRANGGPDVWRHHHQQQQPPPLTQQAHMQQQPLPVWQSSPPPPQQQQQHVPPALPQMLNFRREQRQHRARDRQRRVDEFDDPNDDDDDEPQPQHQHQQHPHQQPLNSSSYSSRTTSFAGSGSSSSSYAPPPPARRQSFGPSHSSSRSSFSSAATMQPAAGYHHSMLEAPPPPPPPSLLPSLPWAEPPRVEQHGF